eukprot:6214194-Pleurochrysis_carterae.AAC.1
MDSRQQARGTLKEAHVHLRQSTRVQRVPGPCSAYPHVEWCMCGVTIGSKSQQSSCLLSIDPSNQPLYTRCLPNRWLSGYRMNNNHTKRSSLSTHARMCMRYLQTRTAVLNRTQQKEHCYQRTDVSKKGGQDEYIHARHSESTSTCEVDLWSSLEHFRQS